MNVVNMYWREFPHNSHLSLYVNLMKNICSCLETIKITVSYLNNCVTGRLYVGCLCRIFPEFSFAIKSNFVKNSEIVVAISHILSSICGNGNEFSASTSGCNGGIFFKIHNFHWSHTIYQICKYGSDR